MEEELKVAVRVWLVVVPAAMGYCYSLNSLLRPGKWRLLAILPVLLLFILLPLSFSTVHLRFITACILVWLAPFRLLLFSFNRGPLCTIEPKDRLSPTMFVAIASLPIYINKKPASPRPFNSLRRSVVGFAMKGLLLALIAHFYPQRKRFHWLVGIALHSLYSYVFIDLFLKIIAVSIRPILPPGRSLQPQFAAPFLSSSLQDFWGRRWNLIISNLLRSSVYFPVRELFGRTPGVIASFIVSAVMHEVLFFYLVFEKPTGEIGLFFLMHGICTAAEISVKKWWRRKEMPPLHPALTVPLTVAFVLGSSSWLFMPKGMRAVEKETEDFLLLLKGLVV